MSLLTNVGTLVAKGKIKAVDKAPQLWFIAGTIMVIGAVVDSSKRRMKFEELKEEFKADVAEQIDIQEQFDAKADENGLVNGKSYTEGERRSDRMRLAVMFGVKAVVNYLPTALLTVGGVCCYGKAFGILQDRYIAAASVIAGLARKNKFLEEQIDKLKGALKAGDVGEEIDYDDKKSGGEDSEKCSEDQKVVEMYDMDPYARIFYEGNPNFERNAEKNRFFLYGKQCWAEHELARKGRLFLNEVYEMLGFTPTKAGQIMGWIYDPTKEFNISFGLGLEGDNIRFVNGDEYAAVLRFNIDPEPIIDRAFVSAV